ncbi:MAG: hypothetical protein JWL64_186 [Frankiales bacterium]|nr:hypothetical protein [Frankiales bacterium]
MPSEPHRRPRPDGVVARLRVLLAVHAGRTTGALCRATNHGGGTLPGRVGLALCPDLLAALTRGRRTVLVSGTNGKTTTTRYLATALERLGPVLSNSDGSNLRAGLASRLIRGADRCSTAVLEVDERVLAGVAPELLPAVVVLLNLTRDQLDRTSEMSIHLSSWSAALAAVPRATVVANADDPLVCAAVLRARPDRSRVVWVQAGQPWHRDCPLCPACGSPWGAWTSPWACLTCGLSQPVAEWRVCGDEIVLPDGSRVVADLGLPGRTNVANAAMAAAAAECLGAPTEQAVQAMRAVTDVGGRWRRLLVDGRPVQIVLAKNPAGWSEVLAELAGVPEAVVVSINARVADGRDPSWLWDVPFERLRGMTVVASGEHAQAVSLRLRYAEVEHAVESDPCRALQLLAGRPTTVVANYTSFRELTGKLGAGTGRSRAWVPSAA